MNIVSQKVSTTVWQDEEGTPIPVNRLRKSEKLRESKATRLAKEAATLHTRLLSFKKEVATTTAEVVKAIREENNIKTDSKGNFTWFNFNRSIKVEANVNDLIKFDEILIDAAKDKLSQMIDKNITGSAFIKGIVTEAFQTSTGKLDTKRVLGLKKHTSRVEPSIKAQWEEAMALIDKSISRPDTKTYFRIWVKDGAGEYKNIELNFSSIQT